MAKVKAVIEEKPEDFAPGARRYQTSRREAAQYLSTRGGEKPSAVPMEPPIGFVRQDPLHVRIRQMVNRELLARAAAREGFETPDEADDFDVGDDFERDPVSPHEYDFTIRETGPAPTSAATPAAPPATPAPIGTATEGGGAAGATQVPAPVAPTPGK